MRGRENFAGLREFLVVLYYFCFLVRTSGLATTDPLSDSLSLYLSYLSLSLISLIYLHASLTAILFWTSTSAVLRELLSVVEPRLCLAVETKILYIEGVGKFNTHDELEHAVVKSALGRMQQSRGSLWKKKQKV